MSHGDDAIGDIYSKLKEDLEFRRDVSKRIGLGFDLPAAGPVGKEVKSAPVWNQDCSFGPNGPKNQIGETEKVVASD